MTANGHHDGAAGLTAIIGAAGRFGRLLVRRLHRELPILALDERPFPEAPADVTVFATAVRRKDCRDLFRRLPIRAVVHVGVHPASLGSGEERFDDAVEDFARLLDYSSAYGVRKLVVVSSADVYGARARNPQFLTEDAPLLAVDLPGLRDVDNMAQSFFWKHPELETVILRPAHLAGQVSSALARYLRLDPVPRLVGYDPMLQLIHEEDVAAAVRLALDPGQRGVFNLAGPSPLPLSRLLKRLGRRTVPVPHLGLPLLLAQLRRMGFNPFSPAHVDYLRFVCMVDDRRAREELGYRPLASLDETVAAFDLWV